MSLSFRNIKRWYNMLAGKSVWHVNQDLGKFFSNREILGYYNNLTEKVTKMPELLVDENLPQLEIGNGQMVYFPVAIFQYGLGAYDLYLKTNDIVYLKKFNQCVKWALEHQENSGAWSNFFYIYPEHPYGAMAQGEGASLLIRAYKYTNDNEYLEAAQKAIDFMLKPLGEGGTTKYDGNNAYLMEYTFKGMVLNGAIFAWWGLYDYVLAANDQGHYKAAKENTLRTIIEVLPSFTSTFWSKYSMDGLLASPFYHNIHVAQMEAMYILTGNGAFKQCATRWKRQQNNPFCKSVAFIKKSVQKLME